MEQSRQILTVGDDPLWYKDAIVYELHVRAFADGNGDGIGDFRGLTSRLDYLQDLGITAIWLLPFYPSPLRDDGYDIADYTNVHPNYGTLADFQEFLEQAHRRGLRVITELVINHTSDQHPWFQRARRAPPGSPERNFYVWSDTPDKYKEARIIFQDFEHSNWSWDPVAKAYYWHRFYSHQPDLNFDNPAVWEALFPVLDFWMDMGVDGMRLDAIPYLFEREGTSCENLPETHDFLRALRKHVEERFPGRMFLAEANQWPEDAVAYFGKGDECHMSFHFPLMPRMFMALRMEDRFPILDILDQTPAIPENCQWALFLRNHDELTLEMVTDEERDYMYRSYAQDPQTRINLGIRRRLAPLLGADRRRIELLHGLLFSLPGTPVLYYGDEIGMGDNVYLGDRNGVRTPMQWSADRNAGFSRANPQRLYLPVIIDPEYHYEAVNVEAQQNNPHSLLWWVKRLIALRKGVKAFGRGTLTFLQPDNPRVLAYVRAYGDERVLVVANLSRFAQSVALQLGEFQGLNPVEMFGRTEFPRITAEPYGLTLGPHSFYWFTLAAPRGVDGHMPLGPAASAEPPLPTIRATHSWVSALHGPEQEELEDLLPSHLRRRRWFRPSGRLIRSASLTDTIPLPAAEPASRLALARVEYLNGDAETYQLPLAFAPEDLARSYLREAPQSALAKIEGAQTGLLYDAQRDPRFALALAAALAGGQRLRGHTGNLEVLAAGNPALLREWKTLPPEAVTARPEPDWLTLVYADRFVMTLFRRVGEGKHPEAEIGRFLSQVPGAPVLPYLGSLAYRHGPGEPSTLAVAHQWVPTQGDALQMTLTVLGLYFERALAAGSPPADLHVTGATLFDLAQQPGPAVLGELTNGFLPNMELLGRRTAELHAALASKPDDPAFAPEPFTPLYQRGLYQTQRSHAQRTLRLLEKQLPHLPEEVRPKAHAVLARQGALLQRLRGVMEQKYGGQRIRTHGNYRLDRVLYTGKDFVITHFEGDLQRSPIERRTKRSPLRDVVSLLGSLHYAGLAALTNRESAGHGNTVVVRWEDRVRLEPWFRFWYAWAAASILKGYFAAAEGASFLPPTREERLALCDVLLLGRAVIDLGDALEHHPDWIDLRLEMLLQLLGPAG